MEQRRDEVSEKSQKYDELNKALGDMNRKLDDGQRRLKAQKKCMTLLKRRGTYQRNSANDLLYS